MISVKREENDPVRELDKQLERLQQALSILMQAKEAVDREVSLTEIKILKLQELSCRRKLT